MMEILIELLPVGLFFGLMGYLGWRARQVTESTALSFYLADRRLAGFVLAMTLVATYGSVSSFVAGPGVAWKLGLGWVAFATPQVLAGFLVLGVLGSKLSLVSRQLNVTTTLQVVRARFGGVHNVTAHLLMWVLGLALLAFFTAMMVGQFMGGARLLSAVLPFDYETLLWIFGLFTILYTAWGGFRSVAWTDTLSAFFMMLGLFLLGSHLLGGTHGLTGAGERLMALDPHLLTPNAGGKLSWALMVSGWGLVGFLTVALPQSVIRAMSYSSGRDLRRAMWVSTLVTSVLMVGMTLMGVLAAALYGPPPLENTDSLIPWLLKTGFDPFWTGLTLVAPLAATMSTVSSLLLLASATVMEDLGEKLPIMTRQRLAKALTVVLGVVALMLATHPVDIVVWVNLFAFGGLEVSFFVPLVLGLFWRRATGIGVLLGVVSGLAVYMGGALHPSYLAGWHAVMPATLVSVFVSVLVSLCTRAQPQDHLSVFFPRVK